MMRTSDYLCFGVCLGLAFSLVKCDEGFAGSPDDTLPLPARAVDARTIRLNQTVLVRIVGLSLSPIPTGVPNKQLIALGTILKDKVSCRFLREPGGAYVQIKTPHGLAFLGECSSTKYGDIASAINEKKVR